MPPIHMNPIVLNNMAIEKLERKDFTSACAFLDKATELILEDSSLEPPSNYTAIQEQLRLSSKMTRFEWSQIIQPSKPKNNTGSSSTAAAVGSFIFTRGMRIRNSRKRHSITIKGHQFYTTDDKAVIAYNTALAYQLLATEDRKTKPSLQTRARNLYLLSRTMLRKTSQSGFKSQLCFIHFFHVAILNNLGQISYDLVDYRSSAHCFDLLSNNLRYLVRKRRIANTANNNASSTTSSSGSSSSSVTALWKTTGYCQSDMAGMFSNTIVETPTTAPCA